MKNISKNLVVAGLGLAIIASGSVFAEGSKTLNDNNSLFGGNLVKEASVRANDLNYQKLPEGEYNIDMVIKQHGKRKQNKISMMNRGLVDKKIIVDKNGQYYLQITMQVIIVDDIEGYLDEFYYYDKDNEAVKVKINKHIDSKGKEIRTVKFPIEKPTSTLQRLKVKVYSEGMNTGTGGKGYQLADPVLDWSNVSAIK